MQRTEPWRKWAKNPLTVRLSVQPTNVYALTNTTLEISLAGVHSTVNGRSCTDVTNGPSFAVDLNPRREYLLTLVATNLQSMELDLQVRPNWQPLSTSFGRNMSDREEAPKDYTLWVDRSLGATVSGAQITDSTNCSYFSNVWRIEIRDEKLFHWYADDKSDDPQPAPGDGSFIQMGPAKSLSTNQIALDWSVGLGRLFDGAAAGRLRIRESGLSRKIYTPTNIYFTASSTNVRSQVELVTSSADGVLRQVKAYQTFVDFVATNDQTTLNFYLVSQVATNKDENGIYTNVTGSPFVAWLIQNPEPSTTNKLNIIETRNGVSTTNSLVFDPSSGAWTLNYGSGAEQRTETRTISFTTSPGTNRIETLSIKYASSNSPAYKCIETYRLYTWGWDLLQTQLDPDNSNLTTTFSFYGDTNDPITFSQLKSITYPDGYWEARRYNHDDLNFLGALQYVLHPWKSLPSSNPDDATTSNSDVEKYVFNASTRRLMWIAHYYGGLDDINQYRWDWEQFSDDATFGRSSEFRESLINGHSLGTATLAASDGRENGLAGHALHQIGSTVTNLAMYYHGGTYNAAARTFTTNSTTVPDGPDWRQSVLYYGYPEHLEASEDDLVAVSSAEGQPLYDASGYQQIDLETNRSFKEVRIFQAGSLVQRELSVFTGTDSNGEPQFDLFQLYTYLNDSLGHATNIVLYDAANSSTTRTIYQADYKGSASYDGELVLWETDENGIRTEYAYDSLKRKTSSVRKGVSAAGGFPAQADIATTNRYDPTGKIIEMSVMSGGQTLTNKSTFDIAGRLITSTDEKGLTSSNYYELGGRKVTLTLPSGATDIKENYLDRRLYSRTGTGVVQETHDYYPAATDPGDHTEHITVQEKISYGSTGTRWKKIGTDWYGIRARSESPDFGLTNSIVEHNEFFTSQGQPSYIYKSAQPTHLQTIEFDFDGTVGKNCTGDSIFGTALETTSRITRTLRNFVKEGSAWFKVQTNYIYLIDNDATPTMTSISKERLSGFSSGTIMSEVTTWDADTNATVVTAYVDRTNKKVTQVTDPAQSTLNGTNITINGLLQWESTPTVSSPTKHFYDGLGRENSTASPVGFTASQAYDQFGQVTNKKDLTGMSVAYEYYPNGVTGAGQLKSETRPNGKKTYTSYTARGEAYRTWGDVPYPQERVYNEYGDLTELHTFRGGSGWSGSTWPASPGTADKTTWNYQAESGLLLSKTDDAGRSVSYTYTNGLLATRTWARGVVTTNSYNDFADLIALTYSDSTPTVNFTNYNRAGLPLQILDGTGTNNLTYDHANRLRSTTGDLGIYNGVTVSNHFNGTYGRDQIKITGLSSTIQQDYGYDTYGRLGGVSNGVYSASYSYKPNSDLLSVTTCKSNSTTVLTTSRTWEFGVRLQNIVNTVNQSTVVSSHTYNYDALNRRTQATLEDGSIWKYDYNDRDELILARRFWPDWTPTAGQQFAYAFDNIGNRTSTLEGGDSVGQSLRLANYTANDLNQCTSRSVPNKADIIGAAYATAAVTVNNNATYRKGEYYQCALAANNDSGPSWLSVTNLASLSGSTNTITGNLLIAPTNQLFSYDADGNLTNDSVWVYLWDGENRLIQMSNLTAVATAARKKLDFSYDWMGRRTEKIVSTNSGSAWGAASTNRFVYDGWNLLGVFGPGFSALQSFTWGQDLSGTLDQAGGIGGLTLATFYPGTVTNCFITYDGNGNVLALINGVSGQTEARYEHDPFGQTIRATGNLALKNPFRFSTKFADDENGLIYYGYRYASPSSGRWISRDRSEEVSGANLFNFCRNNPVNSLDTDGRFGESLASLFALAEQNTAGITGQLEALARQLKLKEILAAEKAAANRALRNVLPALSTGATLAGEALKTVAVSAVDLLGNVLLNPGEHWNLDVQAELMGIEFSAYKFMGNTQRIIEHRLNMSTLTSSLIGIGVGANASLINYLGGNGDDYILDVSLDAAATLGVDSAENIFSAATEVEDQ